MDTTRITDLLTQLEAADPADAPDLADDVTAALAGALDGSEPEVDPAGTDEAVPEADDSHRDAP